MDALAKWTTRLSRDGATRAMLELPLHVAGYDIDVVGHVNNAVYVRWLEDLRTVWMTRWLPFEECVARGQSPVLMRIEIDYRAPLTMGDRAVGRVWVAEAARARAVLEAEITRVSDGRVCAQALQTVCFVDMATGRPIRMPPAFVDAMSGL